MQTLNLKNMAKNLTLIAAGALMATLIAVPLVGSVNADDDDHFIAPAAPPTYVIATVSGGASSFELVEWQDGKMVLVLLPDERVYLPTNKNPDSDD